VDLFFKMNFSQRFAGAALVGTGVALIQLASPVGAATFNFATGASSNSTVKSYLDSGITLQALNSNSTGNNPGTINGPGTVAPLGLCAYARVAGGIGRCGYGTAPGSGISSFQLTFDKAVAIKSFNVSAFDGIYSGAVGLSLDNSAFTQTLVSAAGDVSLANLFNVGANQIVYVRTSATDSGQNGSLFRIGSLTTETEKVPVPAPLPILGAAVGFRFSRRIRKRIGVASLQA